MSFNIALSGVAAAQKDLDVTANNIANVNTVGFKESRAEFGDVYAASLLAGSRTKVGDGVLNTRSQVNDSGRGENECDASCGVMA